MINHEGREEHERLRPSRQAAYGGNRTAYAPFVSVTPFLL